VVDRNRHPTTRPATHSQAAATAEPATREFLVLSWNLWWRFGAWRDRQHAIRAVLREVRPDVCGLQEVWASGAENLAGRLAADLGMHWTFAASDHPQRWQRRIGDPTVQFGNAVLSRWPIRVRAVEPLPAAAGDDDGRAALFALVDGPAGPIPFFTTQLTSTVGASAVRCEQVRKLAAFIAGRSAGSTHPPVLTGDFNAEPDSDEMRLLGGHKTTPAVDGLVLVDAWRYADPGQSGFTWRRANPHVAATGEPDARIDYVLIGPPAAGGVGRVRRVRLVGAEPVRRVWPSDHAGVLAALAG
jgi:endonuclease/exonuclease/phosphatase family metal-dependent hydrolase